VKAATENDPISSHASLLFPAHFRVIVEPGCAELNSVYYACAKNAYLASTVSEALKALNLTEMGCLPKPPECADGKFDWLK
jgi:hypothetical protein